MTGYIVEVDPEIETALTSVMPGVTWKTWTPYFMEESDNLIDTWRGRAEKYLEELTADRISSRGLKKAVHADKVAPMTWTKVVRKVCQTEPHTLPKKDNMGKGVVWKMEGQSLVRETPIDWGIGDSEVAV
jgi:hypothetical protein